MNQVDKMKLTKYGFGLNLLGSSSFLSVLGIVASIIGLVGSIVCFGTGSTFEKAKPKKTFYVMGGVLIILMIPCLVLWILLKIKTSKKDIPGIERIGKVYSYVSGSLEIIVMIMTLVIISYLYQDSYSRDVNEIRTSPSSASKATARTAISTISMIFAQIYLVFACLKIHGVRQGYRDLQKGLSDSVQLRAFLT